LLRQGATADRTAIQYSLSPNKKVLALWLFDENSQKWNIAILNTKSKKITNSCVESKYFPNTPIWSPDSQNFIFQLDKDTNHPSTVLIDLDKNLAVQIAENAKAIGWLR